MARFMARHGYQWNGSSVVCLIATVVPEYTKLRQEAQYGSGKSVGDAEHEAVSSAFERYLPRANPIRAPIGSTSTTAARPSTRCTSAIRIGLTRPSHSAAMCGRELADSQLSAQKHSEISSAEVAVPLQVLFPPSGRPPPNGL